MASSRGEHLDTGRFSLAGCSASLLSQFSSSASRTLNNVALSVNFASHYTLKQELLRISNSYIQSCELTGKY